MRTVRASEIAEYVYCRRAWWLHRVQGLASDNVHRMAAGTTHHAGHGRRVRLALALRVLALLAAAAGGLVLILSLAGPG